MTSCLLELFRTARQFLKCGFAAAAIPLCVCIQAVAQDLSSGLVAHIPFNSDNFSASTTTDTTGSFISFQDASSNGNTATCYRKVVVKGVTYDMDQCPRSTTGPDNSKAAEFYGNLCDLDSDHIGIANAPELDNLTHGTIALWVLYHQFNIKDGTAAYRNTRLIDDFKNATPGTWYLGRDGTTNNLFKANTASGIEQRLFLFPDTNLYSGEYETWNHLAVSWDGTSIKGYFNGTFFKEVSQSKFPSFKLGTYITIGALNHSDLRNSFDGNCIAQYGGDPAKTYVQPNTGFLNGSLDDVRIYNRALSSSEISQLATAPLKRPTVQLRVTKNGNGHGFVSTSGRGISCGPSCAEAFRPSTQVVLDAKPSADSVFTGWTGACTGVGTCKLTLSQDTEVGAQFVSSLQEVARFEAEAATIVAPFITRDGLVFQPGNATTTPSNGGRLEYKFTLDAPSDVLVIGKVSCADTGSDSLFINFDTLPTTPDMVWDIWSTVGPEERIVRWRGNGDSDHAQFDPKWFTLGAGEHTLIIVGRESNTYIDSVQILRRPARPVPLPPSNFKVQQ